MANSDAGNVHGATDGAVAGAHADRPPLRVLAAPATGGQFNTIRSAVFPIACFRFEDLRFDFDSSVVLPTATGDMPMLARLLAGHAEPDGAKRPPPVSIFGHADPVSSDAYNKSLSGRRAAAVYGLLTRRADVWEDLYSGTGKFAPAAPGDGWGVRAIQIMLNGLPATAVGADGAGSAPPPLTVDGKLGPETRARVKQFQAGPAGLAADGDPGPATRGALFLAYMDAVCVGDDGQPFRIDPATGFLARDADAAGKGDYQGCGEFNPVLLFSRADLDRYASATDKAERNAANAPNRRVMVLLFRPGATVTVDYWPCPRAAEGTDGCRKRFWSDGEARRTNAAEERRFDRTRDTFACRFYQRLLTGSPCELVVPGPPRICFVFLKLFDDAFARPLPQQPYTLRGLTAGTTISGVTGDDGVLRHDSLPDDHYELDSGGRTETVEQFYMAEADRYDVPWSLRLRGFSPAPPPPPPSTGV